jgi:long-chain acyl-CoA synthetase
MNFIKRILNGSEEDKPYYEMYGSSSSHIDYPNLMMYELLYEQVLAHPYYYAIEYYGKNITYKKFYEKIETCAKALKVIGVKENDYVTICMPNTPEALIMFYAINMVGAIANMIHPLSSENEIEFYMDAPRSKYILTLTMFAKKVIPAAQRVNAKKIILADVTDGMYTVMKRAIDTYKYISSYFKVDEEPKIEYNNVIVSFKSFFDSGYGYEKEYKVIDKNEDPAVILYSGGTTGKPKGVMLTNRNFNALGMQSFKMCDPAAAGDAVLVILPIFHGFGLGVSVHTELISGMKCVLVPLFKPNDFAKLIKRHHPAFLIGVPTMYEALTKNEDNSNYLKCVTTCICGGDTLMPELRERVNKYLADHGSSAQIRVGYGLTESTAACILTPRYYYKEGGIGLPFPDTFVKIIKPNTNKEVRTNHDGEICISGPTVMLGYLNEPEETSNTLIKDETGRIWLHTGDIGYKDKEGCIFFSSRLKRIIVTSGYNVYPSFMEKIIATHPAIENCVVVGIPHPYKKQVPVVCIVLRDNFSPSEELTQDIKKYCEKSIAKYSMPYRYEYIKSIPKTIVGKVNYKKLEEECIKKYCKEVKK